jgi:hypothetical protein
MVLAIICLLYNATTEACIFIAAMLIIVGTVPYDWVFATEDAGDEKEEPR